MLANVLLKLKSWSHPPSPTPPRQGNVKKMFTKEVWCMGKFRACLCFILPIHTTWWDVVPYPLSRLLYFALLALFFTWLSCLTPNLGLKSRKLSFYKFPRMTKKGKMRISRTRHTNSLFITKRRFDRCRRRCSLKPEVLTRGEKKITSCPRYRPFRGHCSMSLALRDRKRYQKKKIPARGNLWEKRFHSAPPGKKKY